MKTKVIFKKKISLGKIAYSDWRKRNLVVIEIELRQKDESFNWDTLEKEVNPIELSICGEVWNAVKSDCLMCGQCIDEIAELLPTKKVKRIREIWEEYHLNYLQAGTRKQNEILKKMTGKHGMQRYSLEP